MRIYYKKKFWAGVGALLLGLALPGTCLFVGWERFDLKDAVLTMFMVLSGISGILRSLDREKARQDRDEDRDERTPVQHVPQPGPHVPGAVLPELRHTGRVLHRLVAVR